SWAECEAQVKGFKGAVFKSYPTKERAQAALDEGYELALDNKVSTEEKSESTKSEKPIKKYVKNKQFNEFGADEVGKESYGPFVVCAVYYDDEFNQDIFDMQLTDSKAKRIKPKIKEIAEELMDPKNKLKYVVVAMTDLHSMKDLMPNGVDATYNYNE